MSWFSSFVQKVNVNWEEWVAIIDGLLTTWSKYLADKRWKIYPSLVGAILFIGVAVGILFLLPTQITIQSGQKITARTFPTLLTYIILCCALITLAGTLIQFLRKKPIPYVYLSALTEIRAVILLCLLIGYAVLISLIGFLSSSVLYGVCMLIYFRAKKLHYYLLVIGIALCIGYLFKYVLYVQLP